ncbi:MAG: rhodanese-like domain-containing protein [Bdellovibrionales bacterium]|nr:rhodanese-like domain-containing protein [Bdellovibrionales bacterium]
MSLNRISMQGLHDRIAQFGKKEIILDVRGRDEFSEGHIPGALNIPHDEIAKRADELKQYERIYIHCRSGKRAQLAFADLEKQGFKNLVCVGDGGMVEWIAAGYETVQGV